MFFSQLKKNLLIYRYFYLVVVFFLCTNSHSQSLSQLQKKADDLFDKQNYSAALIDFRQLLAQNPTSIQFNYKYGVCLFYSDNRKKAKRYFDFVLRQNAFPSETYYYLAKLYHFDYKFTNAIDYYQKYLDNTPEKLRSKDVANYIKQCENGKLLLKNPKALNIIMANRFSMSKFYINYELQSRTGGFFTDVALQSKIDKKNNFIPMYYFARGDSIKFFASYGTSSSKDIYFSRKINADLWSPATKILGEINTSLDEDYPFFDAQKGVLFFSSMGHNSIGGYDLFQVKFNPLENNTQSISNLDFPYSSADDDFLFVPEVDQKTAYFASNRNCEVNKIDVYAVEFGAKKSTIQLIVGDFYDLVDDKNKLAQIMVVDMNSATEYGPFTTDEFGKYVIVIPGSGKYKFSVTVDGSGQLFENVAEVPEVKDNKRISQTLRYSVEESKEIMVFDNYFSNQELASEEDKLLLISAIASLKMNPTLIKNTPIENNLSNELSTILSDLGYNSPLISDAIEKLHDDVIQVEMREEELITDINRAILLQDENSEAIDLLRVKRNELDVAIKDTDLTPELQLDLFSKLVAAHEEEMALQQQRVALQELIDQKQKEFSMDQREDLTKSATVLNEKLVMLSLQNNDDSTKLFLTQNKDLIQTLLAKAPVNLNSDELQVLQQNLTNITQLRQNKENDLIRFVDSLNTVIEVLKTEKLSANNKDKASIEKQIIAQEKKLFDQKTENQIAINTLFQDEQKLTIDLLKIELNKDLIASEVKVPTKTLNKASIDIKKISVDDILDSYNEKLKVENSIALITKKENQRGELNVKLATLTQQNDSKEKFDELLALSTKIESLINLDIAKAEEKNDFLSANKYNEELQLLKNQQEKYKSELIRIDGLSAKDVQKSIQEAEGIAEQKKTEELAAQAEQRAKQEAERVAEQKKSEELAAQAEQIAKQKAEGIAEQKKSEELAAQAEQRAKQEAEGIAEQKKSEELAAQVEQRAKQEAERVAEQKKTEELAAQAEQRAKQEAESIAEQKKTEELAAQAEQRAKQETEDNSEQITKINVDENTPYSVAIREQLKQLNSESSEDLLTSFDETKKLEQSILSNTDPIAKEKEINVLKVLNESNELIASQIILAAKIKAIEVDYPSLKEINNNNNEIVNALRIQKEVLEDLKKKESVEKVKLIERDIAIITTQINTISSQSESSRIPTPLIFNNNEQLTTTEKESISKDAAYYEYLQERTEYNQTEVSRDSLQDKIYSEKQKLDFLLQQDNRDVSPSKSELELAKLLSEQLLLLNELSVKLEMQGKAITNTANQAKMETMLLEKIQPIQIIAASAKAVTYDFTIGKEVYPVATKLPVLSSSPSGLVFRVQVGAFRKPVAVDKFREFSPVSGEILTNGLTVYLAGYFNNVASALTARKEIRNFGYADAFVVAYCDGKRISIAEARALEQSGRCLPTSQNELSIEVAKLFETIDIIPDVNLAIEKEEIFYTVQVGVYNKRINIEQLPGIVELEAFQSPNGQYRYSSGKFLSIDDAKLRKADIVTKGITDAYVVAYRNGNRIDLKLAKVLIEQKVKSANIEPLLTERKVPIDFNKLTAKNEPVIDYVQFSKMISNTMPSDLLGIANKGGTFVFDPIQNSILSGYINLNSISAFERIYYADMTIVQKTNSTKVCSIFIEESSIKSALHDWLLHCNIPYTIISNSNSFQIQFVLSQNDLIENIEQMASKYNYVVKINEL